MTSKKKNRTKDEKTPPITGYRIVWTFVMFDLPTATPEQRRGYTLFRNLLLEQGFMMMQYSIYVQCSLGEERATSLTRIIKEGLPDDGEVRIFEVTDKQYSRMLCFVGKMPKPTEEPPEQLEFF